MDAHRTRQVNVLGTQVRVRMQSALASLQLHGFGCLLVLHFHVLRGPTERHTSLQRPGRGAAGVRELVQRRV
jgi:hypothetical protein